MLRGAEERSYGHGQLRALLRRRQLAEEATTRSARDPLITYARAIRSPTAQRGRCRSCPLHPHEVLGPLSRLAIADPPALTGAIEGGLHLLQGPAPGPQPCESCTGQTVADLLAMVALLEQHAKETLREAYHVILDVPGVVP